MSRFARPGWIVALALCPAVLAPAALAQEPPPTNAVEADRVTIQFTEADGFTVLSVSPLASKVLPPSDDLPEVEGDLSGFWYELQDADGNVLYRRVVDNPVRTVFEGPVFATSSPAAAFHDRVMASRGSGDVLAEGDSAPAARPAMRRGRRAAAAAPGSGRQGGDAAGETEVASQPADRLSRDTARRQRLATQEDGLGFPIRNEALVDTVFSLLIPRAGEGDVLVLNGSPLEPGAGAGAAEPLAELPLGEPEPPEGETGGES